LHRRAEKTNHCGRNIRLPTGGRIYGTYFPLVILSEAKDLCTFSRSATTSLTGNPSHRGYFVIGSPKEKGCATRSQQLFGTVS
jgi:hypothetical protein